MIYKGTNYHFGVLDCILCIRDGYHDLDIDPIGADLYLPIPVLADLKIGYYREFAIEEEPKVFIRVSLQEGVEHPFTLCAGEGAKVYALPVDLNVDEIARLYQNHIEIPELTDELKADVLNMPVVAKTTADNPENIKKAAGLIRKLARFEIRMANPELINVPGWDTLENCAADELIDKITKWLESKHE